jgi:hypothetical protein
MASRTEERTLVQDTLNAAQDQLGLLASLRNHVTRCYKNGVYNGDWYSHFMGDIQRMEAGTRSKILRNEERYKQLGGEFINRNNMLMRGESR